MEERTDVLAFLEREGASLAAAFAPVADLRRASVAAYDVTLKLGDESARSPRAWSRGQDRLGEIEAQLLRPALAQAPLVPTGRPLVVTLSPEALASGAVGAVFEAFGRLDEVVVATDPGEQLDPVVARVRSAGAGIALHARDGGFRTLQLVRELRPEYVRIGPDLIAGVGEDEARAAAVEALVRIAGRAGALVIGAGVRNEADLRALMALHVPYATGALLGDPSDAPGPLAQEGVDAIRAGTRDQLRSTDVQGLIEPGAALPVSVSLEVLADTFLADPSNDFLVLLDADGRPRRLVDRAALLHAEPFERPITAVTASTPVGVAAKRAVARDALDRFLPLVCCDARGRFVGLVRVDGLLEALAARS